MGNLDLALLGVPLAHVDRDPSIGIRRVFGEERTDELLLPPKEGHSRKYAQVNVWRSIGEQPVQKWPLCFVDHKDVMGKVGGRGGCSYDSPYLARVLPTNDPCVSIRGEKSHDCVLMYHPGYKYRYASNLVTDEALVFSSFHSDATKVAPHGAFWDSANSDDAPVRLSIEVRSWVFFDD